LNALAWFLGFAVHIFALMVLRNQFFSAVNRPPKYRESTLLNGLAFDDVVDGCLRQRTPLSKQRNKHLQTTLIEAAKMAPRYSPDLAMLYDREKQRGHANRATLAVARKLVAYLLAVDRGQRNFQVADMNHCVAA
jgi:transposase